MNRKKFLQQLSIIAALPLLDNCTTKEKKAAATENKNENYIRLLRHATLVIQINGIRILVDPMLSDKDAMNAFKNTPNDFRNPMVALPVSKDELEILLANTDAVLLTHTHTDHWDKAAKKMIDSNKTILCQPADTNTLKESGFKNIITIEQQTDYKGISIHRTGAQHGRGEILKQMGTVSGYVLQNGAKKIYVAGVWFSIKLTLRRTLLLLVLSSTFYNFKFPFRGHRGMTLEILTPEKKIYSGDVYGVQMPGITGLFEVLEKHAPIVSALKKGNLKILVDKNVSENYSIQSGFAEVINNKITVLVEGAVPVE